MQSHIKKTHKEILEKKVEYRERHRGNWILVAIFWILFILGSGWSGDWYYLVLPILLTIGAIYLDHYYKKATTLNYTNDQSGMQNEDANLSSVKNSIIASFVGLLIFYFLGPLGFIGGLLLIYSWFALRSGVRGLSQTRSEFRIALKAINSCFWLVVIGIILLVVVLLAEPVVSLVSGVNSTALSQNALVANAFNGVVDGIRAIVGILALAFLAIAGVAFVISGAYSIWKIGSAAKDNTLKAAAILYLIPYLQVLGTLIIALKMPKALPSAAKNRRLPKR